MFFVLSCSDVGTIILLSVMEILSMIAISSLNDKYGCSSFYASACVNGQPWAMSSDRMPMYLSSSVAVLISSTHMQSGMFKCYSVVLMVIHMPGISLSPLVYCCVWISKL